MLNSLAAIAHTIVVMVAATLISIGEGWAVDLIDGDAELNNNDTSLMDLVQSGDPMKVISWI